MVHMTMIKTKIQGQLVYTVICTSDMGSSTVTYGTLSCVNMSRMSQAFLSKVVNATQKWFCMVVNNLLSRRLGNIAKVYLITCGENTSTCSELKEHDFCPVLYRRTTPTDNETLPGTPQYGCCTLSRTSPTSNSRSCGP